MTKLTVLIFAVMAAVFLGVVAYDLARAKKTHTQFHIKHSRSVFL